MKLKDLMAIRKQADEVRWNVQYAPAYSHSEEPRADDEPEDVYKARIEKAELATKEKRQMHEREAVALVDMIDNLDV